MSRITRAWEQNIYSAIDSWGRDVTIYYNSTSNCNSCLLNPITHDATNPYCSTCNGSYYYNTSTSCAIKAVVKTFLGDKGYLDWATNKINFYPDADIRITCKLEDVLYNTHSATGKTYFDRAEYVKVDGKEYGVKKSYKTGIKDLVICIVNLEEIKK